MNKKTIVVIYEGEKTEPQLFKNIIKIFANQANIIPIGLSAGENIYMLYSQLKDDDVNNQKELLENQLKKYAVDGKIAIISSVPLALLEYFKEEFWDKMISGQQEERQN